MTTDPWRDGMAVCVEFAPGTHVRAAVEALQPALIAGQLASAEVQIQLIMPGVPKGFASLDVEAIIMLVSYAAPALTPACVDSAVLRLTASGDYNLVVMLSTGCTSTRANTITKELIDLGVQSSICTEQPTSTAFAVLKIHAVATADKAEAAARQMLRKAVNVSDVNTTLIVCGIAKVLVSIPSSSAMLQHHERVRREISAMYTCTQESKDELNYLRACIGSN